MIFAKALTYGLDAKIKLIQIQLDNGLTWEGDVYIFGKVKPTIREGKTIPEVYNYITGEMMQIFVEDTVATTIGFHVVSDQVIGNVNNAVLRVLCTTNLDKIHTNEVNQPQKALLELKKILEHSGYINNVTNILEGIPNVFAGYDQSEIASKDIVPRYNFGFEISVIYGNQICGSEEIDSFIFEEQDEFRLEDCEQFILES